MRFSKLQVSNNIRRVLEEGKGSDDALDLFLMMNMMNDLGTERSFGMIGPSASDVHMNLIGNKVIDKDDIILKMLGGTKSMTLLQRLVIKLSPTCSLYVESSHNSLHVTINKKNMTRMYLKSYHAEDVAMWIIRQKQNLNRYMEEWEAVLKSASKKAKGNRIAQLCIRAIFTEGMKDYPEVKYEFIEQKRRVRIKVMIPNTHLGVNIDAWWGSYKERLPEQIENLKTIIDTHSKCTLKNFFVYH